MKSGFSKPIVSLQHKKQQLTSSRHRRQQQHNFQHDAYSSSSSKLAAAEKIRNTTQNQKTLESELLCLHCLTARFGVDIPRH